MFKELAKTIKAQLYDRVSSPLFASFALSWMFCNHRLLVVLFSSWEPQEKFKYIDSTIYSGGLWDVLQYFLVYPLISALLIIFVYPYPAKWTFKYWRNKQRELKVIQKDIDDETPLTKEESQEIRRAAFNESEEYRRAVERSTSENKLLRERVEELEQLLQATNVNKQVIDVGRVTDTVEDSPSNRNQAEVEIKRPTQQAANSVETLQNQDQVEVLSAVGSKDHGVTRTELILIMQSTPRIRIDHALTELTSYQYLEHNYDRDFEEPRYFITHKGRGYLIDHGLV